YFTRAGRHYACSSYLSDRQQADYPLDHRAGGGPGVGLEAGHRHGAGLDRLRDLRARFGRVELGEGHRLGFVGQGEELVPEAGEVAWDHEAVLRHGPQVVVDVHDGGELMTVDQTHGDDGVL